MRKELTLFDKPKNIRRLLFGFYGVLCLLLLSELFIHTHPAFDWEASFGFFAVYGFVSCVLLIFVAKILRVIVMRREDYYDR